jgi:large subunit ribosomal protein L35
MPKMKSHRGARKRMKVTATGKIKMNSSFRRHLLAARTSKRKRQLRRGNVVVGKAARKIRQLLCQ